MAWHRKLWTLAGLATGAAVGFWLWRRGEERTLEPELWTPRDDAVGRLRDAFDADAGLARRGLDIDAVSEGVIEITGMVADRDERERAVALAHNDPDVHTVVNRLVVAREESRLAETRARNQERGGLHHTGMGVGMGRSRQSPDTDPDRPSDRQKRVDRELDVDNVVEDIEAEPPVSETEDTGDDAGREPDEETPER